MIGLLCILCLIPLVSQAQYMGDNLGNHIANKDIQMNRHAIAGFTYMDPSTNNGFAHIPGRLHWDNEYQTYSIDYKSLDPLEQVEGQINQELIVYCHNMSGETLTNGMPVALGIPTSNPDEPRIVRAAAINYPALVFGMCTETIPNGEFGWVTVWGFVHDFPSTVIDYNPANPLAKGNALYLGVNGGLVTNALQPPYESVLLGRITRLTGNNPQNVTIFCKPIRLRTWSQLDERYSLNTIISTNSNYTNGVLDTTVIMSSTNSAITNTLLNSSNKKITIKRFGNNPVTIVATNNWYIDSTNTSTITLGQNLQAFTLQAQGNIWYIIGEVK